MVYVDFDVPQLEYYNPTLPEVRTLACMGVLRVTLDLVTLCFKCCENSCSLCEVLVLSAIVLEGLWALHVWATLLLSL